VCAPWGVTVVLGAASGHTAQNSFHTCSASRGYLSAALRPRFLVRILIPPRFHLVWLDLAEPPAPGQVYWTKLQDSLAEWSKALASGASPQGCGFEPHSCHCACLLILREGRGRRSCDQQQVALWCNGQNFRFRSKRSRLKSAQSLLSPPQRCLRKTALRVS